MIRSLWTARTGLDAQQTSLDVISNNLANVSTNGFRAEMANFRSVPMQGAGATTRVFALEATSGHRSASGPAQTTGRPLDLMAVGNAWFAVQALDGTEAYTRGGALEVTNQGQLVNSLGLPVLSDGGAPIDVPPNAQVNVSASGVVSARVPGQEPQQVGRIKLATPNEDAPLKRGDDGLFRAGAGEPLPADPNAQLRSGVLEGSNVNAVECMVGMIAAQRQFEQQMRLLQTAESDDKAAGQLLSING